MPRSIPASVTAELAPASGVPVAPGARALVRAIAATPGGLAGLILTGAVVLAGRSKSVV